MVLRNDDQFRLSFRAVVFISIAILDVELHLCRQCLCQRESLERSLFFASHQRVSQGWFPTIHLINLDWQLRSRSIAAENIISTIILQGISTVLSLEHHRCAFACNRYHCLRIVILPILCLQVIRRIACCIKITANLTIYSLEIPPIRITFEGEHLNVAVRRNNSVIIVIEVNFCSSTIVIVLLTHGFSSFSIHDNDFVVSLEVGNICDQSISITGKFCHRYLTLTLHVLSAIGCCRNHGRTLRYWCHQTILVNCSNRLVVRAPGHRLIRCVIWPHSGCQLTGVA